MLQRIKGRRVQAAPFDIAIIGGGINGCGIARDAAGRGLSVYLCEKSDLASATSSASTKLIHGGLRYLEYFEFRLVREALMEREVLWRAAPHIIWPLRFVLPHHKGLRPAWLIRLGLFLYDHLGGRRDLPPAKRIDLTADPAGEPLKPEFRNGFEYSDCWVEDSRLVVLNAIDAAARGAVVETRTEMLKAERDGALWKMSVADVPGRARREICARTIVNAAGPWVEEVMAERLGMRLDAPVRLVKGSHIVVPRLYLHDRAYIFQNADGRIVFAIPYERDFTLIGTTDLDYEDDPAAPEATADEIEYLCSAASQYFVEAIAPTDVVWTYAGVRPLYDDGASEAQAATRDYMLKLDGQSGEPPLLNIYGGKITTYRRLAEAALEKLAEHLGGVGEPWTATATLPGGDFPAASFASQVAAVLALCPDCGTPLATRLVRAYGSRARMIVEGTGGMAGLGLLFGADLSEREVAYLMRHEWARAAEDVLWRRSKLGLRVSAEDAERLEAWMRTAGAASIAGAPAERAAL
jgi:glycerol-3-phosphate dehydrogenase